MSAEAGLDGGPYLVMIREARDLVLGDVLLVEERGSLMPWNITSIGSGRTEPYVTEEDGGIRTHMMQWWNVQLDRTGVYGTGLTQEITMPALRPCLVLVKPT